MLSSIIDIVVLTDLFRSILSSWHTDTCVCESQISCERPLVNGVDWIPLCLCPPSNPAAI